ncbi:hypothetical protein ASE74_05230 [Pedobacter sp. Leaf216]|uniref:DUF4625 domain-containing protein n=1 Tax=Pedobacter sp. Leaf216 TaxID=1735684 RepID=UPI0006FC422E|nr:DUF4625 domain-containing protein [Pedobacter sp. Leaf216]KQM69403.1 hypothetical protein ASE74_05230 [Pedobacter sp. Leaf216]
MKTKQLLIALLTVATVFSACKKDTEEIDTEYPSIDLTGSAFPQQCAIIKKGEKFIFKATLNDNVELGSVSVDVHHNFDHHSHSTEVNDCNLGAVKQPVNPFLLIKDFPVPSGLKTYDIAQEIIVPANIDAGDYHFLIRLTDKTGWQTLKGISIKIN